MHPLPRGSVTVRRHALGVSGPPLRAPHWVRPQSSSPASQRWTAPQVGLHLQKPIASVSLTRKVRAAIDAAKEPKEGAG